MDRLETVVVGVDGSADSLRVLDIARCIAEPAGARVVAVHAVGLMESASGNRDAPEGWGETVFEHGSPELAIERVAAREDADLIVVGARGLAGVKAIGSTSHHLLETSIVPVLVVPPGDRPS
ncbi:MAG: universal stress protein [Actinomycetota bacterium]|nr:universal stress protein [Actinomycetota bacterium]